MTYIEVIVDIAHSNVDKIFDYALPDSLKAGVGCRVEVPFGHTKTEGLVLSHKNQTDWDVEKIKPILRVIDEKPIVIEDQIQLAKYICARYRTTMAFALRLMYPAKMRGARVKAKQVRVLVLKDEALAQEARKACFTKEGAVRAKNRLKTLDVLLEQGESPTALLDGPSVRYLVEQGIGEIHLADQFRKPYHTLAVDKKQYEYTKDQKRVIGELAHQIEAGKNQTYLLHGVTGSGKTEVYIAAVKHALSLGKTAIVLVPEISITPQVLGEFSRHFEGQIAVFHSGLSDGERFDEWRRVQSGEAKIVLGARSAVFMPLRNLGIIILDEAHAESYKAENHPPYHAGEIANMRAKMANGVLVLASATPLIEDYTKTELGVYKLLEMPNRVGNFPLPPIHIVDMKREFIKGNRGVISGALQMAIGETLEAGKQALLFNNRRGYASSIVCTSCGHARMCSHCDVPLKYHKETGSLLCHYCGRQFPLERECPDCGDGYMRLSGTGTQKVEEQVREMFPAARVLRMDFDTTRKKNAHMKIFEAFRNRDADILIGTQMISRGLDFSNVTLSAIIAADSLLLAGDYRQEERTFAMIEQVGGRAGRAGKGRVVVQTYNPEHYAIEFASRHDYKGFYHRELAYRQATGKPPFARLFRMVFTHKEAAHAERACMAAAEQIKRVLDTLGDEVLLFTAKEAPVAKLDGRARYHIIIKMKMTKSIYTVRDGLYDIFETYRKNGVQISLDIDPYDMN